jgi:hypothetical protein
MRLKMPLSNEMRQAPWMQAAMAEPWATLEMVETRVIRAADV